MCTCRVVWMGGWPISVRQWSSSATVRCKCGAGCAEWVERVRERMARQVRQCGDVSGAGWRGIYGCLLREGI